MSGKVNISGGNHFLMSKEIALHHLFFCGRSRKKGNCADKNKREKDLPVNAGPRCRIVIRGDFASEGSDESERGTKEEHAVKPTQVYI
jgi:hypothetical protein